MAMEHTNRIINTNNHSPNSMAGISLEKARRLLGKFGDKLSDNQVRELLITLTLLARQQLGYNSSNKTYTYE